LASSKNRKGARGIQCSPGTISWNHLAELPPVPVVAAVEPLPAVEPPRPIVLLEPLPLP
jgi:hypothetical protein